MSRSGILVTIVLWVWLVCVCSYAWEKFAPKPEAPPIEQPAPEPGPQPPPEG